MPLGFDGTLCLVALEPTGRGDAPVVLDALERAQAGATSVQLVVLVAATDVTALAEEVRSRGLGLALAVDDREADRFAFADADGFAGPIEQFAPELCVARVRWHPDDDPDVKKAQALGLTKLGAWSHETERDLLLELVVPQRGDRGADHVLEVVREIRDLGTEADVWSVPGTADAAAAGALDELVRDEGRDRVGFVVRLEEVGDDTAPRTAAALTAYRGVSLSSSVWSDELAALDAGSRPRDEVVDTIGQQLAATIDLASARPPA